MITDVETGDAAVDAQSGLPAPAPAPTRRMGGKRHAWHEGLTMCRLIIQGMTNRIH